MRASNTRKTKLPIDEEFVADIISLGKLTPFIHLGFVVVAYVLLRNIVSYDILAYWLGLTLIISIARMFFQISGIPCLFSPRIYLALFSWLAIMQALIWSNGIVFLSGSIPGEYEVFLILIAGAFAAGAVAVLYPSLMLYTAYGISIMGPIIINLFIQGSDDATVIGLVSSSFLIIMIYAAAVANRNYRQLRRIRATLGKQSSFIQKIYNAAQDIAFISCELQSNDYRIISFSPGSEVMFGCKSDDVVGRPLKIIQQFESYITWGKLLSAVRKDARPVETELDIIRQDGKTFTGLLSIYPVYDEKNRINSVLMVISDITERKRAEESLRASEKRFRDVAISSSDWIWEVDAQGKYTYASEGITDVLGYKPEELIGKTPFDFMPESEARKVKDTFIKIAAQKENLVDLVNWNKHMDGHPVCLLTNGVPILGDGGDLIGYRGVDKDITERKQAEEALRESQQMLQIVLDTIPVRVFWKDRNSIYLGCNKMFASDSGFDSPKEIVGKNDFDMAIQDQAELYQTDDQYVVQTGLPKLNYEEPYATRDGRGLWLRTSKIPLRDLDGNIVGILGAYEDITERKQAEELLRQSEQKYRSLIEAMHDGVVIADLDENIIFTNQATCSIFGYARDELIGMNFKKIIIEEEMEKIYRETQKRKNKKSSRYETTIRRKDGEIRQVLISATPFLDNDETVVGAVGIFSDISELKKAEREKQQLREKLIRAQRMESIGVLAGGVAHDLNNILGPLVAYPELIINQLPTESPIINQISRIEKSARRAAEVVQDLLTMARRGRYEMSPIDLNKVVDSYMQSTDFSNLKAGLPGIKIKAEIDPTILRVYGSASHLSKVVMNLVINAFDAMPHGGELIIRTECKYVERLTGGYDNIQKGKYVLLTISDTGIGIDENDYKRLFEPFYTKKKMGRSGSGLGLAIVYGVIKDHNGYVDVRSEIDKGSDFIVYLPVVEISSSEEEKAVVDIRGSEKILIVDDVEEQRELAATILSSLGYHVEVAGDGRTAVEHLKDYPADVVVLDMIMEEDFDGLDTYREIIKRRPGQKAIIASGFSETDRVKEAEELGVGKYIRKPYSMQILGKAIREVLIT
jgi:two-component system cell cycle sensor histidine kinase/response regulator CckA